MKMTEKKKYSHWESGEKVAIETTGAALTPKREAFAVAVASGLNLSDAYRESGYSCGTSKTVNEAASRLLKNSKIAARIATLRKPIVEKAQLTLECHLEELKYIRDKAVSTKQYGAAISAEVARGRVSGLYAPKAVNNSNLELESMSDEQLNKRIEELCLKLHLFE